MKILSGYKVTVTDEDGIVQAVIQLEGFNLDKPLAKQVLAEEIRDCLPAKAFEQIEPPHFMLSQEGGIVYKIVTSYKVGTQESLTLERSPVGPELRLTVSLGSEPVGGITLTPTQVRDLIRVLKREYGE